MCVAAAGTAATAYAGTVGLVGGGIDFGDTINNRLPFRSRPLAGLALAAIVGCPFTGLTVLAAKDDPRTNRAAIAAGGTLIGWIAVQVAVIRSFSVLQPISAGVGAAFVWAGLARSSRPRTEQVRPVTRSGDPCLLYRDPNWRARPRRRRGQR
jgi:hypothetical protein